ncbi:ParA family protein [Metallosphaera tengchongensis]|uniref:ParA family protein n=1 Tax=Metallosphaera tengchongensis TaxID=1532350 RepID=A0A6N0NV75_9CREN|nr:ParA family protein [Metallosphaera tengchongensis]QKR00716.1 ParA family protein [Metallosphaera tengchongensis]
MRLSILSAKGGVGKSTISLLLAKSLAELGERVMIMDRDPVASISMLLGARREGLVESLAQGREPTGFTLSSGNITVVKCFGQGPRYLLDLETVMKTPELSLKMQRKCEEVLSGDYSFFIVDNASFVMPQEPLVSLEFNTFLRLRPKEKVLRVYISDPSEYSLRVTEDYFKKLESLKPAGEPYAFIINLVPPFEDSIKASKKHLDSVISELELRDGFILPFIEELFQLSSPNVKVPREIEEFSRRLVKLRAVQEVGAGRA